MADEWGTIGWTAQDPPTAYDTNNLAPWKIPADIDTVKVTREFHSLDGGRVRGFVIFRALVNGFRHVATDALLTSPKWPASIGMDGKMSINLPATDTTALTPSPFQYEVTVIVNYRIVDKFYCSFPKAVPEVNLADVVPETLSTTAYIDGGTA